MIINQFCNQNTQNIIYKQVNQYNQTNLMQEEHIQQAPINFGRFSIFLLIKTAQTNYGIKNSDYARYRLYCSRRINKLRDSMNFKYGTKTKYFKKDIIKERSNDSKILQIALFECEKYWAEANETKFSPKRKATQKSRARFVSIKKLKRAVQWSKKLNEICKDKTQLLSKLQSNSYQYYLEGMLQFQQQEWNSAQTRLIASRQIIQDLIKNSDSLSSKIFKERIDQLDQTIKFCNFKISKGKDISITQIIEMKKNGDANLANLMENLTQQRMNQISIKQNKGNSQIRFGQEKYPVKQEKILLQKTKIDTQIKSLQQIRLKVLQNSEDQQLYQELMMLYSNAVVLVEEAIKLSDQERQQGKKNQRYTQGQLEILKKISLHFQQTKINLFLDRGYTIFKHTYNKNKGRKSSPQTLTKLLTAITNNLQNLSEIVTQKDTTTTEKQTQQAEIIEQRLFYLRTLRLYFVGQVYYNNQKIKESYGLWLECQKCLNTLISKQEMKNNKNPKKYSNIEQFLVTDLVSLTNIQKHLKQAKLKCLILNNSLQNKSSYQVNQMVENVSLSAEQKQKQELTIEYLLNNQNNKSNEQNISLERLSQMQIIQLPGNLQPIPTRPIFFDIYQTQLHYPKLENKLNQNKGGRWGGWLKSVFKG